MTTLLVLIGLLAMAWFLLANVVPLIQLAERRHVRAATVQPLEPITWIPMVLVAVCVFLVVISL